MIFKAIGSRSAVENLSSDTLEITHRGWTSDNAAKYPHIVI